MRGGRRVWCDAEEDGIVVCVCQRVRCRRRCFSSVHRAQPPQRYTGESERGTGPPDRGSADERERKGRTDRARGEVLCTTGLAWYAQEARETPGLVVASAVDGGEAIEAERLSVQRQQRRQRRQSGRVARAQRITSTTIDYAQQHRAGSLSRESRTYCALTLAVSARYITALR